MIHLILVDHDTSGSCFKLVSDFLQPYFPNSGFDFCTILFNIINNLRIEKYKEQASAIIRMLLDSDYVCVIVAITNHTDNDYGDPFIGYQGRTKTCFCACSCSKWILWLMYCLLTIPYRFLRFSCHLDTSWFTGQENYTCGSFHVVCLSTTWPCLLAAGCHKVSLLLSLVSQRLTLLTSHRITATISFNAVQFQPSFAMYLLLAFAELIVIEWLPIYDVFPQMLDLFYKLGCHSDVFLMALAHWLLLSSPECILNFVPNVNTYQSNPPSVGGLMLGV